MPILILRRSCLPLGLNQTSRNVSKLGARQTTGVYIHKLAGRGFLNTLHFTILFLFHFIINLSGHVFRSVIQSQ